MANRVSPSNRVSFSRKHQELLEIAAHHSDVTAAIRNYFNPQSVGLINFVSHEPIDQYRNKRLLEIEYTSALSILTAIESAFKIDYLQRCYRNKKDRLSRTFRILYKQKGKKAKLVEDILKTWKRESTVPSHLIGDIKGALNYRNWLAHGRYWEPNLGKPYDYQSIYELAQIVFNSFPFEK